jgi:NarL family two-component system response regulator LiaR
LIVDDQAPMRGALAAFLNTRPNMQVVAQLEDGVEAIRIATELHPDIVVMDLLLPSLDGIEATRQIMLACPDTDVVLLSARMDGRTRADALAAGAVACVSKLGAFDQLERAINSAYDARRASRASGRS